jgi:hypothetical protein
MSTSTSGASGSGSSAIGAASACFLIINYLIGLGVGPLLIGKFSTMLKESYGTESLRYSAVGCTAFYLLAALLMLIAVKWLRVGWVEDEPEDALTI